MRVGADASPLVYEPRRGVARAVAGWARALGSPPEADVRWFLPEGATLEACLRAGSPAGARSREAPRAYRRRLRSLVAREPVDVFLSPVSAFPQLDVPVVATVHELPFVRHGMIEGPLRAWAHRRWLSLDARKCAAIVVPSRATREDVLSLHPEAMARVHVVPHAFDPGPWEGAAATEGEPTERRHVLLVGLTHARKGLLVWEEARSRLEREKIAWTLVGRPADAKVAARLAAHDDVDLVEDADDAVLRERLARASLLVYPSLSEGFGFPPLEAMAAGVPVVATTAGSIPEVCGDAAHLVPPGDPEALAEGIRRVLEDAALRERLVTAGRSRCRAFPPSRTREGLLRVLEAAAGAAR